MLGWAWTSAGMKRIARELAGEYSLAQFVREYQAGVLPEKSFAILSFETAKLGAGRVPGLAYRPMRVERASEETEAAWTEIITVCACPHCRRGRF